ncbi:MAG: hypothetical protein ABSD85_06790 [Acidimicrobiales bacterium]|jgi:hypothetical protein
MATYALAGAPSLSGVLPVNGIATPGPHPRPVPGPLPAERILPVPSVLAGLFPGGGLPKGGTVLLGPLQTQERPFGSGPGAPGSAQPSRASGLTSLLALLLAGTSSQGHWCAVVGLPELGLVAAAELGVDLDRLVLVPRPGSEGRWQSVVTTLLETVDLVCLAPDSPVRPADARRLYARARERRSTLVVFDPASPFGAARGLNGGPVRVGRWPGPSDLRCGVTESAWSGLGNGYGLLSLRLLEAEVGGRGEASRPRRGRLRLPA